MRLPSVARLFLTLIAGVTAAVAQPYAYVSNQSGNNVSFVNLATNKVLTTVPYSAGGLSGLAITPDGSRLYVAAQSKGCVVVIDTVLKTVLTCITVGAGPVQAAVTPNGAAVY